jgi:tripartite-type tricarboxylate transporter receptor subunit TctC
MSKLTNIIFILFLFFPSLSKADISEKIIEVVVPFSPGGPTDQLWRSIELEINQKLVRYRIRLATENIPGAGGSIGANRLVLDDRPKLGFFSPALVIAPNTIPESVKYNPDNFRLVAYAGESQMLMISSLRNLDEFKHQCNQRPILFGSSGVGSISHLFGQIVGEHLSCKKLIHIPYKGLSQTYSDLISGRIDYIIDFKISSRQLIDSKQINQILSVDKKLKHNLEVWHVLVANKQVDNKTLEIIKNAFDDLKKEEQIVKNLETISGVTDFKVQKTDKWLQEQFANYKKFMKDISKN